MIFFFSYSTSYGMYYNPPYYPYAAAPYSPPADMYYPMGYPDYSSPYYYAEPQSYYSQPPNQPGPSRSRYTQLYNPY